MKSLFLIQSIDKSVYKNKSEQVNTPNDSATISDILMMYMLTRTGENRERSIHAKKLSLSAIK